jgi:hypothetical protein
LYEERDREDGHDWDDWFRAERETQHPNQRRRPVEQGLAKLRARTHADGRPLGPQKVTMKVVATIMRLVADMIQTASRS